MEYFLPRHQMGASIVLEPDTCQPYDEDECPNSEPSRSACSTKCSCQENKIAI
ncbi:hypothetical protein CPB84DRAFT_1793248 [Gymnopilus junonius]|uniref:Uncharacterized protein n=1 Tax=Gymnopilus junonius TaxID=109634 RepID=A0A9P5THV2_GYMJU|nr:hypothetical protein CPB84DRAFT_1793248 [Gymnopilus junonius]